MSSGIPPKLRELFEAAAELEPAARGAYLDSTCGDDASLRAAVEELLRHDAAAHTEYLPSPLARPESSDSVPKTIGRYRISGVLGTGGMGVVYEGAQESPQRSVAVKVLRGDMISARLLSRFRNEAEILGRLEHPGIARIYEAGAAEVDGQGARPFFAMELVRGTPLLEATADMTIADRLRVFVEICDAVHHAHQKGVLHRDLKPANILVTADGQAKVLDFGIARATDGDIQAVTMQTDAGQILGTIPYMSPEQITGDVGAIDTRSDVYSLGVVLFELLTGALPHDVRNQSIAEAARVIRDEESTRLTSLLPSLRGDLEWIVAKALEKEADRRYDSASALAADVRRHLADEPVLAGPPSVGYRARKFVRRNRGPVAATGFAALVLVVGVAATIAQTVRATRAEQRAVRSLVVADREADRARVGLDFLVWAFGEANRQPEGEDISLRRTLDLAAAGIGPEFVGRDVAEADVRRLIGRAYWEISRYGQAKEQLELAFEPLRTLYHEDPDANARGLLALTGMLQTCERELGNGEAAAARWYFEGMDIARERLGRKSAALARALDDIREVATTVPPPSSERVAEPLVRAMAAFERDLEPGDADGIYLGYACLVMAQEVGLKLAVVEEGPAYPLAYLQAALGIFNTLSPEDAGGMIAMGLWMEARSPAPPGQEEQRIKVARKLELIKAAMPSRFFQLDAEGILGDALLQRGHDADGDEIARRLIGSHRELRAMGALEADVAAHPMLDARTGMALLRLAGLGLAFKSQDDAVIYLLDRPDVLDELEAGIDQEADPQILSLIADDMRARPDRSDRWYAAADRAERAATDASGPISRESGNEP